MQLHIFPVEDIKIPENRQRKIFDETAIQELAASIADNGLIQPIVVRSEEGSNELSLVSGERRLKALDIVWGFGQEVRCGTKVIPERCVPCLFLGDIDPIDAFEIELEENIRRTDLDWKERAQAVNQLFELRNQQAKRDGKPPVNVAALAEELSGGPSGGYQESVRKDIILARNLDNPAVAKAATKHEAFKALQRSEESRKNEELGRIVGATFTSASHTLIKGDCLEKLKELPNESFDVILTDPPYGIGADEYGDSGGKTAGAHFYDDSFENFKELMIRFGAQIGRLAKPQSHLYLFCDIENFKFLKDLFTPEWKVFRTPFIWINPTAMRTPWIDQGPQRKWQMILYAVKGNKTVTRIYPDVLTYPSDPNLGHQAQKPVALYSDLLNRSVRPGDSVLDPFAGTGVIFPAAHGHKCKATGIEIDEVAYGIAAKRLKELK
jgi:site-specific DNA-methyltransferase (adenine-specific)